GLNKHRPQIRSGSERALGYRLVAVTHLPQQRPRLLLARIALLVAAIGLALPGPPMGAVRLALESSAAGNRDVLLLVRVDERRVVHALQALPAREDQRQIMSLVLTEAHHGTRSQVEVHIAAQMNRAGEKLACG